MKKLHLLLILILFQFQLFAQVDPYSPDPNPPAVLPGYKLSWSDEFNYTGKPSSTNWSYETGFVRNEEHQWYQSDNANVSNGTLQITGRRERVKNPNYQSGSSDWKKSREYAEYTSAAIHTRGKQSWKYGRFEIRAKIPATTGAWPAIWTLGNWGDWPTNGEIDILEYYGDGILANAAWGSNQAWVGTWDSSKTPMSYFKGKDANWVNKYHIWVMDWTPEFIKLYVDGELLNTIETYRTLNSDGSNPFTSRNHYVLLNLALGGVNGGDPSKPNYPITYYVDYFRVYQPDNSTGSCYQPLQPTGNLAPDPECNKVSPDGTGSRKLLRDLTKVYCGNYCAEITGGTYAQYINFSEGKTYRVKAMVYANGSDVILSANDTNGSSISSQTISSNLNQWQAVEFTFLAPATAGSLKSGIFLSGAAGSRIDNVEVYETDEPFVSISRNELAFNLTKRIHTFRITAHKLSSDLILNTPEGISVDKNRITPQEAENGVVITATFNGIAFSGLRSIVITGSGYTGSVRVKTSQKQFSTNNLAEGWDANGLTGTGSEPDKFGWTANGSVTWRAANATSDVRYSDQTSGSSYSLNDQKWTGRLLHLRWDGSLAPGSNYAFPVELEGGKVYTVNGVYGWQANGDSHSVYSISVNNQADNKGLQLTAHHKTIKKTDIFKLNDFAMVFRPVMDGTYYLTFDNTNKIMGAVGDLMVREGIYLPGELTITPSSVNFSETYKTRSVSFQGKYIRKNVIIQTPDGITANKATFTPDEINDGIVSATLTFDGSRDITNELINITCGDIIKTIPANAVSYQTAVRPLTLSASNLKAYSKAENLVIEFELTEPSNAKIEIFSIQGVRLAMYNQNLGIGKHSISDILKPVAGHYIVKLTCTKGVSSKRFVVY